MSSSLYLEKYRVYTKPEYVKVYQRLKGLVFNEYHTLFALCVYLGYRNKKRIIKAAKKELFWSHTFSAHELTAFHALFVLEGENGDYSLLKDGEKAVGWLQDYANGGMEILLESDILKRFIIQKDGEIDIDCSSRDNLQKQMMYYVFKQYIGDDK